MEIKRKGLNYDRETLRSIAITYWVTILGWAFFSFVTLFFKSSIPELAILANAVAGVLMFCFFVTVFFMYFAGDSRTERLMSFILITFLSFYLMYCHMFIWWPKLAALVQ